MSKIIENPHRWEQSVYGYGNSFSYIVYAFWAETQLSRKISMDFFAYVCLFAVVRHIPDNDRSQLLLQEV